MRRARVRRKEGSVPKVAAAGPAIAGEPTLPVGPKSTSQHFICDLLFQIRHRPDLVAALITTDDGFIFDLAVE